MIYANLRCFHSLKVLFMPVIGDGLMKTAEIMEEGLGKEIVMSQSVSKDGSEFSNCLMDTIRDGFRRLPGIS